VLPSLKGLRTSTGEYFSGGILAQWGTVVSFQLSVLSRKNGYGLRMGLRAVSGRVNEGTLTDSGERSQAGKFGDGGEPQCIERLAFHFLTLKSRLMRANRFVDLGANAHYRVQRAILEVKVEK
jgi:hypothetical protein